MSEVAAAFAHQIGFVTGVALYAVLLVMVWTESVRGSSDRKRRKGTGVRPPWHQRLSIPLAIAVVGLFWNVASLASGLIPTHAPVAISRLLSYAAISALGWLPALALHSVWQAATGTVRRPLGALVLGGHGLSAGAAMWNGVVLSAGGPVPDAAAWRVVTDGFLLLFFTLLLVMRRALAGHGGLVLVLLAVCSVAALPLSHHSSEEFPWWLDFLGHHASLPVAAVVLYRDYRFVFVDRFVSRALSLLLLIGIAVSSYVLIVAPWMSPSANGSLSPMASGAIMTLGIVLGLGYPWLDRQVTRLFDTLVLERPDYHDLRRRLEQRLGKLELVDAIMGELCQSLQWALKSREVRWERVAEELPSLPCVPDESQKKNRTAIRWPDKDDAIMHVIDGGLTVLAPTWEPPRYLITIAPREDGHRFLSEELTLVEEAVSLAARRIDALRTSHERCEIALREQEMQKLATEAELRALRAQVNPHFLFNALNTIGYLIDTAPARAASTLRDLTHLLRSILRRMEDNFTTLGEELDLVRAYLDIEQARFEERLSVHIDVPRDLHRMRVPALVLQPLVENAVKHGIQPSLCGGEIRIAASLIPQEAPVDQQGRVPRLLCLEIADTGAGASEEVLKRGRERGIGLRNVENRLRCLYGAGASLRIISTPGVGTTVTVQVAVDEPAGATVLPIAAWSRGTS